MKAKSVSQGVIQNETGCREVVKKGKIGAAARLGRAGGEGAEAEATIVPRPSSPSSSVLAETLVPLHRLPVTLSVEEKCGII